MVVKHVPFESSVNSYDSQTTENRKPIAEEFESSVNSYDSQTDTTECIDGSWV